MREARVFAAEAWRALGGDPRHLARLQPVRPAAALASRLDVTGLAADSVAVGILALHGLLHDRGAAERIEPVRVDGDRLVTSIQSERHFRLGGEALDAWAPLSGFWRAADGWVRTHGNYPHHADRLRRLLGLAPEDGKDAVASAIATRGAQELEDRASELGAIVVRVRAEREWAGHPQAAALRAQPLIAWHRDPDAPARPWPAAESRPLAGIRVLDLTRVIAGPIATRDLAFCGADVLRVDSPRLPEIGWQHLDTGQGKRSTLLDLAAAADRATFQELLASADVLVAGYRPGALERLGLSPEELRERHPGLVVASVSAWGGSGPWASRRGFDSIVQAVSGIAMVESDGEERPGALPAQVLDHSAGHFLAAGIVRALGAQRREGGTHAVSVALARVAQSLLAGPRWVDKREPTASSPALQTARTRSGDLTTALPVLTYAGAPGAYPRFGDPWASADPEWC